MSDRPGSQEARRLYRSPVDVSEWKHCLDCYDTAVICVANGKSKSDLVQWDAYLWNQLVTDVNSRNPRHITLSELADVMRWKLARGKARPLQKLVESNPNSAVMKASMEAFRFLEAGKWEKAIDTISALKGIGVATATAIFAPFDPSIPFMADETMEAAVSKRDYTMKVYRELREALITKAAEIQSMDGSGGAWNGEKVGKALWVKAMIQVYPDLEEQIGRTVSGKVNTASDAPAGANAEKVGHVEQRAKTAKRKSAAEEGGVEVPSRASTLSDKEKGKDKSATKRIKR